MRTIGVAVSLLVLAVATIAAGQRSAASPDEIKQAEHDVPRLVEVLELEPGMSVADIGAGFGAMSMVLAKWLGRTGQVYATDVASAQLAAIRELASHHGLDNIVVLEGAEASTNLPNDCCDAIYMRDVYHHFTRPAEMNKSLFDALKAGGRLAIIDFESKPGSKLPDGVAENRGGHGVPPAVVVSEVTAAGLTHIKSIPAWLPDSNPAGFFLLLFHRAIPD